MQELQIGRVYRHFKGDYYLVEAWRTIQKAACPVSSTASCTGMAACGSARWRCSLAG